jgi:tripartite-type tricarboxylate transporter receptor subunit TctC
MRAIIAAIALAIGLATPAGAQTFPSSTIKFVVGFPPGGAADILARGVAQKMSESLGQSVIVENRAGVAGTVGAAVIAHAAPDGYTIGMGTLSSLALNPFMSKAPPYDPRSAFAPIAMLTDLPILLATPASLPPNSFAELVDYAKKAGGKFNFSSNGVGSSGHILGEMMKRKFGFEASHVPYGGDVPILNALMGDQIQLGLLAIPAAAEFIKAGRVKAVAVSGRTRSPIIPDVPTVVEIGHPDLVSSTWFSVVAPAGTPKDILALYNREVNKALGAPEVKQIFKGAGLEPSVMELDAFTAFVKAEQDKWAAEIKALDLHVD